MQLISAEQDKENCEVKIRFKDDEVWHDNWPYEKHIVMKYDVDPLTGVIHARFSQEFITDILTLLQAQIK